SSVWPVGSAGGAGSAWGAWGASGVGSRALSAAMASAGVWGAASAVVEDMVSPCERSVGALAAPGASGDVAVGFQEPDEVVAVRGDLTERFGHHSGPARTGIPRPREPHV